MPSSFLEEIDELIRARYTLIWVLTWEEQRARKLLAQVAAKQQKSLFEWSITDGFRRITGPQDSALQSPKREREPLAVLNEILQANTSALYLLKDFHAYLDAPEIVRQIRDLGHALYHSRKTLIILSPRLKIPAELEKSITIVDLPLPSYDDLAALLKEMLAAPSVSRRFRVDLASAEMDALIKAALGLTLAEAENAFARAIVRDNVLDSGDIQAVIEEKKQVIRKSGLLEYCDAPERMQQVGGMDLLKDWLAKRVRALSPEAQAYGLPSPRGVLLLGVQGCGKSLMAKTIADSWRLPLLRMDMSRIFQGYIGSSEENMRRALQTVESLSPVILWVDEIEKALSGVDGSSATDAGTTARVVGQFLTWMQEKTSPAFIVATANSIGGLPPELLRKGRLDEIFFVDLPRGRERGEIFQIHLKRIGRDPNRFDLKELAQASKGFSGAEIEQAIISALHDSFFENRELETRDILKSLSETVPLSRTMREQIEELRTWARHRARPVSSLQHISSNTTPGETRS
ncbi:MAG TPA: AAA family ATPase [Candidatus Hydrogenedentes bacterium]|nr:AAA family ATPase [Candidatus Hydrogenedentota bacterium]